jgi:hypothetical protein
MTNPAADTKELMIVIKEPTEDDVLLGQGHYRHPGNQMLNDIVDSKVHEYRNQSRPFKTYMAHEIIHSLRSKGVRFLKELAGRRGWIIVKDDKEAREKVAQRFQYMMRKQAEDPFVAQHDTAALAKQTATKQSKIATLPPLSSSAVATSFSSAEVVPSQQPNLIWDGSTVKVPFLPVFHQLHKSSVMVDDDINEVSKRLLDCFHIIGIQNRFNHEQANALLSLPETLKIQMNLWKPLGGNCGVIVELVNLGGDHEVFKKYSRYILEAATGLFQKYSHTLFQSGRLASVQDHAKAFNSAWATADSKKPLKIGPEEGKPGMVEALSDKRLQGKKDKKGMDVSDQSKKTSKRKYSFKIPPVKRLDQSKMPPLAPKEGAKRAAPEVNAEMDSMTGCFASAFSRWESGIGASDHGVAFDSARPSTGLKHSLPGRKSNQSNGSNSSHNIDNLWEPYPIHAGIALSVDGNMVLPPTDITTCDVAVSYEPCVVPTTRSFACDPVSAESPRLQSFGIGGDKRHDGQLERPKATAPTTVKRKAANTLPQARVGLKITNAAASRDSSAATVGVYNALPTRARNKAELAVPMLLRAGNTARDGCDESVDVKEAHPYVVWARVLPHHETRMMCDNSVDDKMDAEMLSIVQATKSIKRLSLSSNDASCIDPLMTRELIEAFPVGVWPVTSPHQEMGCDSSWDDGSKQSFIPTAFFGSAYPTASSTLRVPNAPSPAHSLCSQISVEMRSVPSSPSFSLPSPACSFNSKCSLGMNSLRHARMDASMSPSMFQSDQSLGNCPEIARTEASSMLGSQPSSDSVPPTIFVDSSALVGPSTQKCQPIS